MPVLAVQLILDRLGNDFLEAAISMVSPVDGLRPSRAGDSLILNWPKLFSETSSPSAAAEVIAPHNPSSIVFSGTLLRCGDRAGALLSILLRIVEGSILK